MLPVENRGVGALVHAPDVCLTPPVPGIPVPYINVAPTALVVNCAWNVLTTMIPTLNTPAVIAMSFGDEPGVLHWTIKGFGVSLVGIPHVLVDFLPVSTLCNPAIGNRGNAPLGGILVPSVVNTTAGFASPDTTSTAASDPYARPMTPADIERYTALLAGKGGGGAPVQEALLPGGVGWLDIRVFSADVPARAYGAIRRLQEGGMEILIIDLRGNPGGEVMAAVELAGDFLERGAEVITRIDEDGDRTVCRALGSRPHGFPVFVLIDGDTASAAEVFAGSLKANHRAVLIGQATRGKGVAQRLLPGAGRASAQLATVERYELPGGAEIEGAGVEPDIPWAARVGP